MKNLKFYSVLMTLLLVSQTFFAQSAQRTLVKSFNVFQLESVIFDVPGEVKVQEWNQPMLRVQMEISLENGNDRVLKKLIIANRFNLESKRENGKMFIFSKALANAVTFGGEEIKENINFLIKVPKGLSVNFPSEEVIGFAEEEK